MYLRPLVMRHTYVIARPAMSAGMSPGVVFLRQIADARRPILLDRTDGALGMGPWPTAGYAAKRRSRPPIPRGLIEIGSDVPSQRTPASPSAHRRMADTRVTRAPRFALQPRSSRSGGHNPTGRQAIARPLPKFGSKCTRYARVSEIDIRASVNSEFIVLRESANPNAGDVHFAAR